MTFTRAVQFYRKYEGLMTDDEIFAETGFSADRIRRQIIKSNGQLCWTCANACDDSKCRSANFSLGAENVGGKSWNTASRPRRDVPVTQTNLFGETKNFSQGKKKRYEYIIEG